MIQIYISLRQKIFSGYPCKDDGKNYTNAPKANQRLQGRRHHQPQFLLTGTSSMI